MISLTTAIQLKEAGLKWVPALHDFFAIPERNLDERLFVISDMLVTIEQLSGMQVVSFQGASEWALDYLLAAEAVWIPREDQLRKALEAILFTKPGWRFELAADENCHRCMIPWGEEELVFEAEDASQAYAAALLFLLNQNTSILPPTA
jgi:hypothetical protein